ncbi:MAG: aryl-sulfate sulfotransferase [Bacteroidota bacterium]
MKPLLPISLVLLFLVPACTKRSDISNPGENRLIDVAVERFPLSPLTALARFRTTLPSKVTVIIKGQDGEDLTKNFEQLETEHEVPILGLYPNFINTVILRVESNDGTTALDSLKIQTKPLPKKFQGLKILHRESSRLAEGFFFILLYREFAGSSEEGMFLAIDNHGKIRWAYLGNCIFWAKVLANDRFLLPMPTKLSDTRKILRSAVEFSLGYVGWYSVLKSLPRIEEPDRQAPSTVTQKTFWGNIEDWVIDQVPDSWKANNTLVEIDLFGRERKVWKVDGFLFHHDCVELSNGNLLALAGTWQSVEDLIVEIDRSSNSVVRTIDFKKILDYQRPPAPRHVSPPDDWLHLNALYLDSRDSSIVVSARNQSAVVKLSLGSLQIRWIMGNHEHWPPSFKNFLLQSPGKSFEWEWGQHAPVQNSTDPNRILLFDNGNLRGYDSPLQPEANFSRGVEFELDEANQRIKQIWQFGQERGNELYSPVVGSVGYLPNGNRLICFGAIARDLAGNPVEWIQPNKDSTGFENRKVKSSVRIIEASRETPARVYLELSFEDTGRSDYMGYLAYRAFKFPIY